jgi:hypothetical protein
MRDSSQTTSDYITDLDAANFDSATRSVSNDEILLIDSIFDGVIYDVIRK